MSGSTLNPSCFTSDGTYLYAHALVTTTDMGANTNVLVKSNASPASLTDISWTLVSAVALGQHYLLSGLPMEGTFVCTVDSTGVFTVLDATSRYGVTDETPVIPRGLQYTPGTGGASGTWTNIDVSAGYKWSMLSHTALFPLGGTLMQVYRTSIVTNTITVSAFNKANNTFVEQSTPYILDTSEFDNPVDFAFNSANSNLFTLWTGTSTGTSTLITSTVSATGAALSNSTTKSISSNLSPCDLNAGYPKSAVFNNQYYLWCQDLTGELNYVTSSNGVSNFTTPIKANTSISQPNTFIPMGSAGAGATWAFMTTSTPISTTLYELTLSGPNAGAWQTVSYSVVVDGLKTSGSPSGGIAPGDGSGGTGGISGGSSSGGISPAIIGAVAGVAVLVVLGGGFFLWRRHQNRKKDVQIIEAYQPTPVMAQTTYGSGHGGAGAGAVAPPLIPERPLVQPQVSAVGYAPQPPAHQAPSEPQEIPVVYNPENYYPPPPPIQTTFQDTHLAAQTPPQNPQLTSAQVGHGHNPQETPAEMPLGPVDSQEYQQQQSQFQQYAEQYGATTYGTTAPGNPHSDMDSSQPQLHASGSPYLSDSTTVVAPSPFMYNGVLYVPQDPQSYPSSPLATNSVTTSGGTPSMTYSTTTLAAIDHRNPQLYIPGRAPQGTGSAQYQGPPGGLEDGIPAGYVRAPNGMGEKTQ
ncbi:hypothetical protein EMPS_04505 [Entomortierella parvispora]|uniref:Transmembrane protein n=1 Tax=Entomortierella parvispora TaxID=205924 RepID=A0A9P3H970_9FUNG|nr:hypothetical protein EMPS_04505 [Entomortierella parvispora]